MNKQVELLGSRRFLPLFLTQIFGALDDNLFKSSFIILVTYVTSARTGIDPASLSALSGACLIAPYIVLSATAGQLADRFERSRLLQILKAAELVAMAAASASLLTGSLVLSLVTLVLLGIQATLTSPVRYALLPQYLGDRELVDGNAVLEGGTFLAILIGTIGGGIVAGNAWGPLAACVLLALCGAAGLVASLRLPPAPAPAPDLRIDWNLAAGTLAIMRHAAERRDVHLAIMGISWFWLVGATFVAEFPGFAKTVFGADEGVVTLFLAAFSIGVGVGSSLCGRALKGEVSARYVPFAALAMALFSFDLWFASASVVPAGGGALIGVGGFLAQGVGVRILIDLLLVAIAGGFFIVPLYAIVQQRSDVENRARIVAANNVMNAIFITAGALVTIGLLALGLTIPGIFLVLAVCNAIAAVYVCGLLPQAVLKGIFQVVFRLAYRAEITGLENVAAAGSRVVIVANHVSYLDGALLATYLPGAPTFAVDTEQTKKWYARIFLWALDVLPLDPRRPMAAKSLIKAVRDERPCVIFPEGRLNTTGGTLMKVYDGPGMVADKADAMVLPVRIDGVELTRFSRLARKFGGKWFPKVTITVLEPVRLAIPPELRGRVRRQAAGSALYDVMSEMMARRPNAESLFGALLDSRRRFGGRTMILEDINRRPMSYDRLVTASTVLGRRLARHSTRGEMVGILLPNAVATAVAFFALQSTGRVPAMLNYTAGGDGMASAATAAKVKAVLTSRRFVDLAKLGPAIERLGQAVAIVWLEDLAQEIGLVDKLYGLVARPFAARIAARLDIRPEDPAVVLFTSGSEGSPKGVVLSHANLLANRRQLAARVDFSPADRVLNALPVFHSFGLLGGFLLPLLSGVPNFLYPSPLHYRIIPEVAYDLAVTILFGTDTFLAGYARAAHPYDFYALRYVFAGAERVRDETRKVWGERFGKRIMEGYGVTECSPVIALNTPMHFRAGTVGRLMPLLDHRLDPVPGIAQGGRLFVRGPNIMVGYLRAERPGLIEPPSEGWYDTGDIVDIDHEGFVTILGRAKRFAKIAGEMVPLGRVEAEVAVLWPQDQHAVVALPDQRKGEQLVLVTTAQHPSATDLAAHFKACGLPELMVPRTFVSVAALPLLGTGKTDYIGVKTLAEQRNAA